MSAKIHQNTCTRILMQEKEKANKQNKTKQQQPHGSFMYNRKKPRSNTNVFSVEWIHNADES